MDFGEIRAYLREPRSRSDELLAAIRDALRMAKEFAVAEGHQDKAKEIWCLETVLGTQIQYVDAFQLMKTRRYYDAWCTLEQVEIKLRSLARHHPLVEYHLEFIVEHTKRFQAIFPYKKFVSAGYVVK